MNHQMTVSSTIEPSSISLSQTGNPSRAEQPDSSGPSVGQTKPPAEIANESKASSRCAHISQSGRRCRLLVPGANPRFCPRHAKLPENLQPDDLTTELTDNPRDLDTFDGLHSFLEALVILLSQNRISTRRAAVLGYLTSQLTRTLSAAHKENGPEESPQVFYGDPRPIRD